MIFAFRSFEGGAELSPQRPVVPRTSKKDAGVIAGPKQPVELAGQDFSTERRPFAHVRTAEQVFGAGNGPRWREWNGGLIDRPQSELSKVIGKAVGPTTGSQVEIEPPGTRRGEQRILPRTVEAVEADE